MDVLLRHKAVLLRKENECLIVAMADPENAHARTDLATSAGYSITAVTEETARACKSSCWAQRAPGRRRVPGM